MIQVAALTSGRTTPSSRFRIRQHIATLRETGIEVKEYVPAVEKYAPVPIPVYGHHNTVLLPTKAVWACVKLAAQIPGLLYSWGARITWLERSLVPGLVTFEFMLRHPIVLDVDDAIWMAYPFGRQAMKNLAKTADLILAGNQYIAEWFSAFSKNIEILPTAVDTDRIQPRATDNSFDLNRSFRIGWTGTSSNFFYLYSIEHTLQKFLKENDAELWIISDRPPSFNHLNPNSVTFIQWSPNIEFDFLTQMDIGIMPLLYDEWSLGKCGFKLLQYMAAGIPVIATPVGMSDDLLSLGQIGIPARTAAEWHEALEVLYRNRTLCQMLGFNGRQIVEKYFSLKQISKIIERLFKKLA